MEKGRESKEKWFRYGSARSVTTVALVTVYASLWQYQYKRNRNILVNNYQHSQKARLN